MSYKLDPLVKNEGWTAFEQGYSIVQCPYPDDGEAIASWMEGWVNAQRYYEWKNETYNKWINYSKEDK